MGLTPLKIEGHLKIGVHPLLSLKKGVHPPFQFKKITSSLVGIWRIFGNICLFFNHKLSFFTNLKKSIQGDPKNVIRIFKQVLILT